MAQTTLRLEYSAFFSSGLLAQHTPQKTFNSFSSWDDSVDVVFHRSPSRPSSPIPIPDDSLMDVDVASHNLSEGRRSITPTPQTITPTQSPQPVKIQLKAQAPSTTQPKLRKRRSSLTQATSPMNAIRSPTRAANNALHLQRQLSPRSRSGSVSGEDSRYGNIGVASNETSLEARMRSGSLGSAPAILGSMRRRPIRRLNFSALPAPLTPPPTAPLPALPPNQQQLRTTNLNSPNLPPMPSARTVHTKTSSFSASTTSARARGLSVSNSALDGDANRIDEDMKEN